MKKFILKTALLLAPFITFISCSSLDDIKEEHTQEVKKVDISSDKFYAEYKSSIQNLTRSEFSGLNPKIKKIAYRDFSPDKKADWWSNKIESVKKNKGLTNDQVQFLNEVKGRISSLLFFNNINEIDKLSSYVQKRGLEVGFDFQTLKNIFIELNDVDDKFNLVNYIDKNSKSNIIATEFTINALINKNSKNSISNSLENTNTANNITSLTIPVDSFDYHCGNSCFWCGPEPLLRCYNGGCTTNGNDCGFFGGQRCDGDCK